MELVDEPLLDLSFINPVTLTTWETIFNNSATSSIQDNLFSCLEENLEANCKSDDTDTCPVPRCLDWLYENKSCVTEIPSDIVSDYRKCHGDVESSTNNLFSNFKRAISLLKDKINEKETMETLIRKKEEYKQKMKPTDFRGNKKNLLTLRLNFNTNKPCCQSKVTKENSEEVSDEQFPLFMKSHVTKSYTNEENIYVKTNEADLDKESFKFESSTKDSSQRESSNRDSSAVQPYSSKSVENSTFADHDALLLNKISHSYKASRIISSESDSSNILTVDQYMVPKLDLNQRNEIDEKMKVFEGNSLFLFLESVYRKHSSALLVPKEFSVCYRFYVYMYPSQVDNQIRLFLRRELRLMMKDMDPFDIQKLIFDMKSDVLLDRRLEMIENHCKCKIVLEPLSMDFIKGLPRRPVAIYSMNYEDVCKALSILEEVMPEIMKTAILKEKLPSTYSKKWSSENLIHRPMKLYRSNHGSSTWTERIDKKRRFPSINKLYKKTVHFLPQNLKEATTENWHNSVNNNGKQNDEQLAIDNAQQDIIAFHNSCDNNQISNNVISISLDNSETTEKDYKFSSLHSKVSLVSSRTKSSPEGDMSSKKITTPSITTNKNQSFQYQNMKRIKCPSSIFSQSVFADENKMRFLCAKYQCCIVQPEPLVKEPVKDNENQIKLTIMYNSKQKLYRFCQKLGLSMKRKNKSQLTINSKIC